MYEARDLLSIILKAGSCDIDFLINVLSSYSKNKNKDNIIFNLAMSSISVYETYILPRMLANKKNNHSDLILFAQNEFKRIGTYEHNILTLKLSINFFIDICFLSKYIRF